MNDREYDEHFHGPDFEDEGDEQTGVKVDPDYLLGRVYNAGGQTLQVVAVDPQKGIRCIGAGYPAQWLDFNFWQQLHDDGVLQES